MIGLKIEIVLPQSGLALGFAPLFIIGMERATMASVSWLVVPQEPRPVVYQVMSPVYGRLARVSRGKAAVAAAKAKTRALGEIFMADMGVWLRSREVGMF